MNHSEGIKQSFARIWLISFVFASIWIVPIFLLEQQAAWLVLIPLVGSIATFVFYQVLTDFPNVAQALRMSLLVIGVRRMFGTVTANARVPRADQLPSSRVRARRIAELFDKSKGFPNSLEAEYFHKLADDLRVIDIADLSPQAAIEFSKLTFTLIMLRVKYLEGLEKQGVETRSLWKAPNWYAVPDTREYEIGTKLSGVEISRIKKIVGVQTIYLQDLLNLMRIEDRLIEKTAKR